MKTKLFLWTIIVGMFLCLSLGGPAKAADTINIGFMGPFTGPAAFNGEDMKKGAMVAVDEINAQGGLFGMKINLILGDSESKPAKGVAAVKKLITNDKVLAVGGGYHSSVNIATSEICEREKTPNVVAVAIAPAITGRGFSYVFRVAPMASHSLLSVNEYMDLKKPKIVAFFMENSDYGRDGEKIWSDHVKKLGIEDAGHFYFQIGDSDFTTQISKLKELKPDWVFSIGSTTEEALIMKQAKELNFVTQWVGAGGHFTEAFFKMLGLDSLYALGVSLEPTLAAKNPVAADFVTRYEAKYKGDKPTIFSGQAYDGMMVIFDAIKRAGKPTGNLQKDRDAVRNALPQTDMNLTQGKILFDKTGQVYTVRVYIVQVQNVQGKPTRVVIYPPDLATAQYQTPQPWNKR
jgi:branched-chain amino acid transport system substrate-binding protein